MYAVRCCSLLSPLFTGAIFGFFYAWVCSTMWGLDVAAPEVAIQAMQAMNSSVRNAVFAPAFFGTPFVLALTAMLALKAKNKPAASFFGGASIVYFCFGMMLTMLVNVPMNEALAAVELPSSSVSASEIWKDYSTQWQFWNQMRTIASGVSLVLCGLGIMYLKEAQYRP